MAIGRTGGEADVVERQLAHAGVELEQQRERLANATGGTEDGDLGGLRLFMSAWDTSMAAMRVAWPSSGFAAAKKLMPPTTASAERLLRGKSERASKRTWRADAEKARRWAWAKAFLAANMMNAMGYKGRWAGAGQWQMMVGEVREVDLPVLPPPRTSMLLSCCRRHGSASLTVTVNNGRHPSPGRP